MIVTELLWGLLVKGSLIILLAWLICLALRRSSAAYRHATWLSALAALLLLPVAALVPAWNVSTERSPVIAPLITPAALAPRISGSFVQGVLSHEPGRRVEPFLAAPIAWGAGLGLVLCWVGLGALRVRRVVQSGVAWDPTSTVGVPLGRRVRILRCCGLKVPATAGVIRPVILLPEEAAGWEPERLQMVIAHESAHIRRGDWLWQTVAQAACAVSWFNPLAWLAAKRLRVESEFACDDFVLRTGVEATDYAQELLQIAGKAHGSLAGALSMARSPAVEDRLRAIVDGSRKRGWMSLRLLLLSVAFDMALLFPVAILHAVPGATNQVPKDPKAALSAVIARYGGLRSFDATIIHHMDSGLFPGDYVQVLHWTKPTNFTLDVTKPSTAQGNRAGNFACDGSMVHTVGGSHPVSDRPLNADPNLLPGYEVSGGPILSWLLKSPSAKMFLDPPKGMTMSLSWGDPTTWHGVKVRVMNCATTSSAGSMTMQMFLNDRADEFLGYQFKENGTVKYLIYSDQKLTQ